MEKWMHVSFYRPLNDYGIKILIILFRIEQFNDCWKTNAKVITPTNHNQSRQHSEPLQSEFLAISCNLLKEWEK